MMSTRVWTHEEVEARGLLEPPVDAAAVAGWPEGARQHFAACRLCRGFMRADQAIELLREAPPLTLDALLRRLRPRRAPPLAAFAEDLPRFAVGRYRGAASALTLRRTAAGVRAWDPDAHHLLLFGATEGRWPKLLAEAEGAAPGVEVEAAFAPPGGGQVFALSARGALDREMWGLWLADYQETPVGERPDLGEAADRLHAAALALPPAIARAHLQVQPAPLPAPTAAVQGLLRQAATAGRSGQPRAAASRYGAACARAATAGDATGSLVGSLGLAVALQGLGYDADAEDLLRSLAGSARFDVAWGEAICQQLAEHAFLSGALAEAAAWLDEVAALRPSSPWQETLRFKLARASGDRAAALALGGGEWMAELPAPTAQVMRLLHVADLARAGQVEAAARRLAGQTTPLDASPVMTLVATLARAQLQRARGQAVGWEAHLAMLRGRCLTLNDQVFPRFAVWALGECVDLALEDGAAAAARELARLRLLHTDLAGGEAAVLGAFASPSGVFVLPPVAGAAPRRLGVDRATFLRRAAQVQQRVQAGELSLARSLLFELLPVAPLPPGQPLLVASDGLLDGLPLQALLGGEAGLPVAREMTALRRDLARLSRPVLPGIASLADAAGDLPQAGAEVSSSRARVSRRGTAVTRSALEALPPVGLVHLGVHAERRSGGPVLLLADGPLGAPQISELSLEGAPVVLLSGCATGNASAPRGLSRSLADAFLQAGARAVVATRWPVRDDEMARFVRALLAAWPFDDPAAPVARVCEALRAQGEPPRLWAAPVVY